MPIWLRNLTYKFISEQRQKENESYTKNTSDKGKKIDRTLFYSNKKVKCKTKKFKKF